MQRDIQALLSPEEFQHYTLYLSDAASELQGRIGDAAVDDDQYVRLFQAEADYGKRFREGKDAGSVLHAAMWTNSDTRPLKAKITYDTFMADLTPEAQTQFNATKLARLLRSMQEPLPTPPR